MAKREQESSTVLDIEDACLRCESLDTEDLIAETEQLNVEEQPRAHKKIKTTASQSNTISRYFSSVVSKGSVRGLEDEGDNGSRKQKPAAPSASLHITLAYCSLFPKRVAKKQVAQEECVVCMVELCQSDGSKKWLIEKRPDKGVIYDTKTCCSLLTNSQ